MVPDDDIVRKWVLGVVSGYFWGMMCETVDGYEIFRRTVPRLLTLIKSSQAEGLLLKISLKRDVEG